MPLYDEIIKKSQENVNLLSEKLKVLDTLHQDILKLKKSSEAIPDAFNAKFEEIVQSSKDYTNILGESTKTYLDGNNTLFTTKLSELSAKTEDLKKEIDRLINTDLTESFDILQKIFIAETRKDLDVELKKFEDKSNDLQVRIDDFKKEVTRLVNTDFTKLFEGLQNAFIDQTRKDLEVELKKFQDKSNDFQIKIYEFKKQIDRLENIDLVKHFDKLQKTLSEIFGAINSINLTLTSITQNLSNIAQSLGAIQSSITKNQKDTLQVMDIFKEAVTKHLDNQDINAKRNTELLENKMNILVEHNELLRKGIKSTRMIQFIGFILILIVLIYVVFKH